MGDEADNRRLLTKFEEFLEKFLACLVRYGSAEWVLDRYANGGGVLLLRSILIAGPAWAFAIWFRSVAYAAWPWSFDGGQFLHDLGEYLPWFAAIYGAVYAALYTRFASQWSYLADTYNQLMATQAQIEGLATTDAQRDPNANQKIITWKVAFIEDLDDLHLATKSSFAMAIWVMFHNCDIRDAFDGGVKGRADRRKNLEKRVTVALKEDHLPSECGPGYRCAHRIDVVSQTSPRSLIDFPYTEVALTLALVGLGRSLRGSFGASAVGRGAGRTRRRV